MLFEEVYMSKPEFIRIGDNVANLNIYEIINKYFGKNYRGWGKATFSINDEYAAWFPTIYETNTRPDGNYGGTRMWSNTLSPDKKTIIEVNHDLKPGMFNTVSKNYFKKRVVFGRIDGHFRFLGVFKGTHVKDASVFTTRYERINTEFDLRTLNISPTPEVSKSIKSSNRINNQSKPSVTRTNNNNTPIRPKNRIRKPNGEVYYICARCNNKFQKANRCPKCGQLIKII